MKKLFLLILPISQLFAAVDSSCSLIQPHSNKVIFSETATESAKWRCGIRFSLGVPAQLPLPLPTIDFSANINGWFDFDFLRSGWNNLKIDSDLNITDLFWTIGVRSKPFQTQIAGRSLNIAGGLKFYNLAFEMVNSTDNDTIEMNDKSMILYLVETMKFSKNQRLNLLSSVSFRKNSSATYFIIPSYSHYLSNKWSANLEYYMTNSLRLPHKIMQFTLDEDRLDFYNSNRDMVSFMFYGVTYTGKHIRFDFSIGNHISFSAPHIIIAGLGWQF